MLTSPTEKQPGTGGACVVLSCLLSFWLSFWLSFSLYRSGREKCGCVNTFKLAVENTPRNKKKSNEKQNRTNRTNRKRPEEPQTKPTQPKKINRTTAPHHTAPESRCSGACWAWALPACLPPRSVPPTWPAALPPLTKVLGAGSRE